ncbi:MAG: cytidine deaminase [Prolixibacteraceae bacterium]|nr:cytidine deaminase [Prolixibacteraceae bacterium]
MQNRTYQISAVEFETIDELTETDRMLILKARKSSRQAYAPYSGFYVGAAVLLKNGLVISGNNQENCDFTDGLCAERVALFYAQANYPDIPIVALAVSAKIKGGDVVKLTQPCGSCRQVLIEAEVRFKQPISIILDGKDKIMIFESAESLLPFAFKPDSLD